MEGGENKDASKKKEESGQEKNNQEENDQEKGDEEEKEEKIKVFRFFAPKGSPAYHNAGLLFLLTGENYYLS